MLPAVIVFLTLLSLSHGQNPAIQLILTDKGLQYGKHVAATEVQDWLEQATLPDYSGKVGMGALGSIDYTLTGTKATKCDFPEPSVEFLEDIVGLRVSISGFSIALTGGWTTHYGLIHDRGSFDMAVFGLNLTSESLLQRDPDGRPSLSSYNCDATIQDVYIQFHGGGSWIFQPFVDHFKGRIKADLEARICPYVKEAIGNLEHSLQAMNVSLNVGEDLSLDLPLTGYPVINAGSLKLGMKGEFYSISSPGEPPFESQNYTLPDRPGSMLSLGLSEFTLNSALYIYTTEGMFHFFINDSMIPHGCPVRLNTSSMGPYIPQLPQMFPDLLMTLLVYPRETPLFSFQPDAVTLGLQGAVKAVAIQKNGTETPLFTLFVDSTYSGKVWIDDEKVKASMKMTNFTLTLAATEVGTFETGALEGLLKAGTSLVLEDLNDKLKEGYVLPRMRQAQLVNTFLQIEKGFIAFSSDAQVVTD